MDEKTDLIRWFVKNVYQIQSELLKNKLKNNCAVAK